MLIEWLQQATFFEIMWHGTALALLMFGILTLAAHAMVTYLRWWPKK